MAFNHNKDEDVVAGDGPSEHNYDSGRLNDTEEAESIDPDSGVKRGLKNRHLSMMALAGIIGPGLLVGAGGALNVGGPAALLIGFGVVGMMFFVLRSLKSIWDQEVLFSLQILTKFNANSWQVSSPSVLCSPLAR